MKWDDWLIPLFVATACFLIFKDGIALTILFWGFYLLVGKFEKVDRDWWYDRAGLAIVVVVSFIVIRALLPLVG